MKNLTRKARSLSRIVLLLMAREQFAGAALSHASRGARHLSLGLKLKDPTEWQKAIKLSEAVAMASSAQNVIARREGGMIVYQFELPQGFWESYTRADLPQSDAVGLAEMRMPVVFSFDNEPHALFAGATNSGKTEGIKSALISLLGRFSPDELGLIIIDQKNVLRAFDYSAHLTRPRAVDPAQAQAALVSASAELTRRIRTGDDQAARLLIVIDEASLLPSGEAVEALAQIARLGREYNVNLIVGIQRPRQSNLPEILDNLNNRFVGRVDSAQASQLATGQAGLAAHRLTGQGDTLHVAGIASTRFQVAQATPADFDSLERGEVSQPVDTPDLPQLPEPVANQGGRPPVEADPVWVARYFWRNPWQVSRAMGAEMGLTRTEHERARDFAIEFTKELKRLRRQPTEQ